MFPHAFEDVAPASLDEAAKLLAQEGDDAKALAGGQSFLPMMKLRRAAPRLLVDVGRIAELGAVARFADGGLDVGARATHAALERRGDLAEQYPLRPAADWGAVLLALEEWGVDVKRILGSARRRRAESPTPPRSCG